MSRTRRRRCLHRCYGWLLCKTRSSAPSVVVCCWQRCIKYREVFHSKYRIKKQRIAMLRGPYIGDIYSCYLGVSEAAGKRKSGGDGLAPACSLVQAFCSVLFVTAFAAAAPLQLLSRIYTYVSLLWKFTWNFWLPYQGRSIIGLDRCYTHEFSYLTTVWKQMYTFTGIYTQSLKIIQLHNDKIAYMIKTVP